jgi:hypothetical protein
MAWVEFPPNLPKPGRPCGEVKGCGMLDAGCREGLGCNVHSAKMLVPELGFHSLPLNQHPASSILLHETHHRHHSAQQA